LVEVAKGLAELLGVPNRLLLVLPPPNNTDEGVVVVLTPVAAVEPKPTVLLLLPPGPLAVLVPVVLLLGKSCGGPGVDPANNDDDPLGVPVDVGVADTPAGDKEVPPKVKPVAAAGVDGVNVFIVEEPHVTMAFFF